MPGTPLEALLAAIKKAAPPRAWSRGVILAREDAVQGRSDAQDEINLAVRVAERPVPLAVVLYPETGEWDCDCAASAGACAHVAAGIIALTQAREAGQALPARKTRSLQLRYRIRRGAPPIIERLMPDAQGELVPAVGPLAQLAARGEGARVELSELDLRLDPLLPGGQAKLTEPEQVALILAELSDGTPVLLDRETVRTARDKLLPRGRVEGDAQSLQLSILPDRALEEVLGAGLGRAGDLLRPLGELALAGPRWERLPIRKTYARAAFGELALEAVPLYRARFEVEIATAHLPGAGRPVAPRIELRIEHGDGRVAVSPDLVYGEPPRLRVEGGRPIYLQGAVPPRDIAAERRLVEKLRDELNLVTGRRVVVQGSEAVPFLRKLRDFQLTTHDSGEAALPVLVPRLSLQGDRCALDFEVAGDEEPGPGGARRRAEGTQVLHAFLAGHDAVPLIGGGWGELPRDWLGRHGDRLALLLSLCDQEQRVPLLGLPVLAELCRVLDHPPPAGLERLRPLLEGFERIPEAALPELRAELRPYQRQGASWLAFLRELGLGAVLADDMGLGKTLQAISAIRGRSLVVCPTSVLPNWASELARFRPSLSVSTYYGPGRALDAQAEVTLTTYALLRSDAALLQSVRWACAILDEAQAIKNADSQTARAAFGLNAGFRLTLTGTPVENRLEELWSQLHFTNPGLLYGRSEFSARFARPIADGDQSAAARLRERIRPFVLRRLKKEVARELPPRTEMVLHAELAESERAVYDSVRLATQREVVERLDQGAGVMAMLEALLRLRQACCHSGLIPGQSAESSAKLDTLMELLSEVVAEGHKALVFSQWTSLLDLLEPHLRQAELRYLRLDGSSTDRGALVARFQSEDGPPVMIVSLKAGGTGLNLTAADHVILLDPWWNPAVEDQAADRAHRIGQERPVMVYRIVARDTVEERILGLQSRKRAIADTALGEAGGAAALTRQDLLALLE